MTIKKRLFSAGSRWLLFPWLVVHYEARHPLHWCASFVVALQDQLFPSHLHVHSSAPALHFSKSSYFPADPGCSRHAWLCSSIREWQHPRLGSHNPFLVLRDEIQTENGEMGFVGEQKTFVCQNSSLSPMRRLLWSHARGRYRSVNSHRWISKSNQGRLFVRGTAIILVFNFLFIKAE